MNKEGMEKLIKRNIEKERRQKYTISLPAEYEDDRTIEFTRGEVDDIVDKLESKPERKFSISLSPEYVEILDDIAKRETKRWKTLKFTRNGVIKEAIDNYIRKRGYIVTKEWLSYFQELSEFIPLMALCKDAKKISDFPSWVRGYWVKTDPLGQMAEYVGNDRDQEVEKSFREMFKEARERTK